MDDLWLASLAAFFISLVLTPILRDVFRSFNVVDRPGHRRVHTQPIPRIGGIDIALAYGVALYAWGGPEGDRGFTIAKLLPGATLVFLTGLADDFWNLRPLVKLAGQVAAASLVFVAGLRVETLGSADPLPLWFNFPLTVFWLLLTTNALNLIDGLDGLCGGIGLLATLTMFGAAALSGNAGLMYVTLPLACALLGFLFFNFNPATVFMGDSGALLIGFLLGCYGMIWTQKTSTLFSLLIPLIALSIPLLDVALAVVRRTLLKQPVFSADRAHIHHRLLDRGLTPLNAVLVLYLFAGLAAGLALLLAAPQMERFHNLVLAFLAAVFLFGIRELRYREFRVFGSLGRREGQAAVKKLNERLSAAQSNEAFWDALVLAASEQEWTRVTWDGPHGLLESRLEEREAGWTLAVPLGDLGTVRIEGRNGGTLTDIAAILRNNAARLVGDTGIEKK